MSGLYVKNEGPGNRFTIQARSFSDEHDKDTHEESSVMSCQAPDHNVHLSGRRA